MSHQGRWKHEKSSNGECLYISWYFIDKIIKIDSKERPWSSLTDLSTQKWYIMIFSDVL